MTFDEFIFIVEGFAGLIVALIAVWTILDW